MGLSLPPEAVYRRRRASAETGCDPTHDRRSWRTSGVQKAPGRLTREGWPESIRCWGLSCAVEAARVKELPSPTSIRNSLQVKQMANNSTSTRGRHFVHGTHEQGFQLLASGLKLGADDVFSSLPAGVQGCR